MNTRRWAAIAGRQIDRLLTIFVAVVLCAVGALALGAMPNASAHETEAGTSQVEASSFFVPAVETVLNVRTHPRGEVLWEIGPSNIVRATGETDAVGDRSWIEIVVSDDRSGWVVRDLLRAATGLAKSTAPLNWQTLEATTNARIRNTPAGTAVRQANEGSTIQATGNTVEAAGTEWTEIELDSGLRGWIASYLLVEGSNNTASEAHSQDVAPDDSPEPAVPADALEPTSQNAGSERVAAIATPTVTSGQISAPTPAPQVSHVGDSPTSSTVSASCGDGYYRNVNNDCIRRPSSNPTGASAKCKDGTYSYSQNRRGTCSHHGGVAAWLN